MVGEPSWGGGYTPPIRPVIPVRRSLALLSMGEATTLLLLGSGFDRGLERRSDDVLAVELT